MTHPENADILSTVVQLLTEQGSAGFAEGIRLLVNEAMVRERSAALRAEPYQRSEARLGHSNGFKDKTLSTRVGKITFDVPQVRGGLGFYPSALEKGIRSEQAIKVALAEMYVQGVSTRKVSAIVEQLCGTSVSSSQVSACAAKRVRDVDVYDLVNLGTVDVKLADTDRQKGDASTRPQTEQPFQIEVVAEFHRHADVGAVVPQAGVNGAAHDPVALFPRVALGRNFPDDAGA